LTVPPIKESPDTFPAVSPDGHTIAFSRSHSLFEWEIYVLDLNEDLKPKGEPRQLTSLKAVSSSGVWTPNGQEIIFASGPGLGIVSGIGLWRVKVSGQGKPERLLFASGEAFAPAISHNGNRLAYERGVSNINLWRLPLSGSGVAAGAPAKFFASTHSDFTPQYSPDGRRIVFSSDSSGAFGIWVSDANGANAVELFSQAGKFSGSPCWSPEGQRIAFDFNLEGNMDIYVIRASGGKPLRLTNDAADDQVPSWSRDGNWIYFTSLRSGRREVWKVPAAGGEAVQTTRNGGFASTESFDGKTLYYTKGVAENVMALWKMPVSGGEESLVLPSVAFRSFSIFNDGIYFIPEPDTNGKFSIQFLSFVTGREKTVAPIPRLPSFGMTISPDRRSLVYTQFDEVASDLMLVENFS
jgi:eukaryotic-like serine/threonine-protein kinase